jgi:hypothetical protein
LLAAALREGLEEMRMNPLAFRFLGPLPPQRLAMFRRDIYPLAGWLSCPRRFHPNWEVERIVEIPLHRLLEDRRYARYRLRFADGAGNSTGGTVREFPCFVHEEKGGRELLWGATYRIVTAFLERVFGFAPPSPGTLPVIRGVLGKRYLDGGR